MNEADKENKDPHYCVRVTANDAGIGEQYLREFQDLDAKQKDFLEFVLSKHIETGVEELDQEKLPDLLKLKYLEINDAAEILSGTDRIRQTFIAFQKYLYEKAA